MKRRVSSLQTPLMRFIFPGFIGVMLILGGAWPDGPIPPPNWFSLFVWIVSSIFIWRTSVRLNEVSLDQQFLYISNFLEETSIPLSEIKDVTENGGINIHTVTIHLYSPSKFGDQIVFVPTTRLFGLFSPHPVVAELKQLATSKSLTGHTV